jgi:hypothetical protein
MNRVESRGISLVGGWRLAVVGRTGVGGWQLTGEDVRLRLRLLLGIPTERRVVATANRQPPTANRQPNNVSDFPLALRDIN